MLLANFSGHFTHEWMSAREFTVPNISWCSIQITEGISSADDQVDVALGV
jgi:hypothetical protein